MLSFILAKSLFGRIYTCTYCVLFLVTILDILERWLITDGDVTDQAKIVFILRSTLVYILYFSICQFGVLVLAKTEQIRSPGRMHAPLTAITIALQQSVMALLFERYVQFALSANNQLMVNLFCNAATSWLLWDILSVELREVEAMNNTYTQTTNGAFEMNS